MEIKDNPVAHHNWGGPSLQSSLAHSLSLSLSCARSPKVTRVDVSQSHAHNAFSRTNAIRLGCEKRQPLVFMTPPHCAAPCVLLCCSVYCRQGSGPPLTFGHSARVCDCWRVTVRVCAFGSSGLVRAVSTTWCCSLSAVGDNTQLLLFFSLSL